MCFSHLITLSALANTFGGIVRLICSAVLRLISNSNFLGCSTGIEDLGHKSHNAPNLFCLVGSIGHQATGFDKFSSIGYRR